MRGLCVAIGTMLVAGAAQASGDPAGWRAPTASDVDRIAAQIRMPASERFPGQQLTVSGDFDGDGKGDRASLLVNDKTGRLAVFVFRGAGGAPQKLGEDKRSKLPNIGLSVEPAGTLKTACGKGYGPDKEPCKPSVTSKQPMISVTYLESSQQVLFWNGRRFDAVFLSD